MTASINGTTGVTFPDASVQGTAATGFGFKNRIINGAMMIDQRNAGASVAASTTSANTYTIDRWCYYATAASKFTIQQNAGSVTPAAGFVNYLGVTSSAATTFGSTDLYLLRHFIEGYNTADFGWGTANAVPASLSFNVYSSLTGTFTGNLQVNSATFVFSYSVPVANTWTKITIPVAAGPYSTNTNNTIGVQVNFTLGAGSSNLSATSGWQSGYTNGLSGCVFPLSTNGATFYITGVQLEKGSTATSFDYRPYGTEEFLCMRYGEKLVNGGNMAATDAAAGSASRCQWQFKVTKRATPTVTNYAGGTQDRVSTQGFQTFAIGNAAVILDGAFASAEL